MIKVEPTMNTPIEWQDDYSVGVKELDDQHKNLLDIINTLIKEQGDEYNAAQLSEAVLSLIH
jgi:hemerythrin